MLIAYLLGFCRVVIGLVFLVASITKVQHISAFEQSLAQFNLLPAWLNRGAARLLIASEAIVVLLLIRGGNLLWPGFVLAISLLLIFSIALGSALARRLSTSCNCFGASTKPISPTDLWRNGGFLLCALAGCLALTMAVGRETSLQPAEWVVVGLAALLFFGVWLQIGEIIQLFRATSHSAE